MRNRVRIGTVHIISLPTSQDPLVTSDKTIGNTSAVKLFCGCAFFCWTFGNYFASCYVNAFKFRVLLSKILGNVVLLNPQQLQEEDP